LGCIRSRRNQETQMNNKEDIITLCLMIVAMIALTLLGYAMATMKMEKLAIAHGAATYNMEGEFVWIKK
jgi:hypothetical protein